MSQSVAEIAEVVEGNKGKSVEKIVQEKAVDP